jgi:hypothetical protein
MGFFTARNRQPNPFAERKRREREQREAEQAPESPAPVAVPVDRNPDSAEYTQAPDISTYATGGYVGQAVIGPPSPYPYEPVSDEAHVKPELEHTAIPAISPETQAKIDAVVNHAIPPVAEPETPPDDEPKRGRGRPRPQETIDRDNAVHALLVGADAETGISKEAIAAELQGVAEQQVYSSLRQLTKEGRAETRYVKPHGYRWFAV